MSFRIINDDVYLLNQSKAEDIWEDELGQDDEKNAQVYVSEDKLMSKDNENTLLNNNSDNLSQEPELDSELYLLWLDALD